MGTANRIEVVCGSSGAGKTQAALRRYGEQVREHGEDTALLILPTTRVVRQARERLVTEGLVPGLLDPRIFTFPQLAQLVLNANHECATAIGASTQALLLKETIERLASAGELPALGEVSRLPGFGRALGELIEDLKRAAVRPGQFSAALQKAGLSRPAHREVAALYAAYQQMLLDLRYFDEEGLFWLARDVLREGRRRPLERVELMVVDGFTDFTTTQLDMLEVLAAETPGTLLTLDHSPDDTREGLAPWFGDTLARVTQHLGGADEVTHLPTDSAGGPLAHLRANLFAAGAVTLADAGGRVRFLTCPGRSREVREVLARVKGLLVTGQARPGEIGIIGRDLRESAREIQRVAERIGVPVSIEAPRSPVDSPAVRAVLHAYETVVQGYRREDVLALLRSTCFTFEALTARALTAEDVAVAAAEALVVEGRDQWLKRLRRYADRPAHREDESGERKRRLAAQAADALADVFALLPAQSAAPRLPDRVVELRRCIAATDVWRNVARADLAEHASANLRALEQLERALDELEHARPGGLPGAGVPPGAFYALLREVLDDLAEAPPPPARDRVSVLDARQARQVRFATTFVISLCEGEFPRKPREEPFFSVGELARLEKAGVLLERRRSPEAYEPLLFYGAVASAERELWLTHPSVDVDGKPLQPSHYVREVRRLFIDETIRRDEIPLSEMVGRRETVADPRELADLACFDLTADGDRESPAAYNALAALPQAREWLPRVLEAVRIEDTRDSLRAAGPYVGEIEQPGISEELALRFGAEHCFTASDLTAYAVCPFDFLCRCVLMLAEPEYASVDLDPRLCGTVRHNILGRFARQRIRERPGQPLIAPGEEEQALAELGEIIRAEFRALAAGGKVAEESLWAVEEERCRRDMALWVRFEAERFGAEQPIQAEFPFAPQEADPLRLPGREDILLKGRIDRVDVVPDGFALIDYKSGAAPSKRDIENGLDLQFPIYTIGAEARIPEIAGAACAAWHYYRVTPAFKVSGIRKPDAIAQVRATIEPRIGEHVDAIRAGRFGYVNVTTCSNRCASAGVCRHQIRRLTNGSEQADEPD
jgi:ATP-dependent helicase/nuclease subunit B